MGEETMSDRMIAFTILALYGAAVGFAVHGGLVMGIAWAVGLYLLIAVLIGLPAVKDCGPFAMVIALKWLGVLGAMLRDDA
jgi:hypothetical protein